MGKQRSSTLTKLWDRAQQIDPVNAWASTIRSRIEQPPFQMDINFVAKLVPLMETFNRYFDAEVRDTHHLRTDGPALVIGNHSGGVLTPDTSALLAAWYRTHGLHRPLYGLAFDAAFGIPGFATIMRKIGQLPASHQNAAKALRAGHSLLVYPGGVHEVFRPYSDRNQVDFAGRKGFIRLALREGVPVIPVVGHGGHETTIVLSRGESLAQKLGMNRLRMNQYPILLQLPWGVSTPGQPGIPLPAKITMQVCEPIDWSHLGPEAADNDDIVEQCYREITERMQETLTALARENPKPLKSRIASLFKGPQQRASTASSLHQETARHESRVYSLTPSNRQAGTTVRAQPAETRELRPSEPSHPGRRVG